MKRAVWALLLTLPFVAGCGVNLRSGGRGMLPEIPVPARPVLRGMTAEENAELKKVPESIVTKVSENFQMLHLYVNQLEVGIKKYNQYAEMNNRLVRKELGLPDPQEEAKPKVEDK